MKKFIINYSIEILTVIMLLMITFCATVFTDTSIIQKILLIYMLLFTLHEWEENRYPGGFVNIMQKMLGATFSEEAKKKSHIPVVILLLCILLIPFIFDENIVLTLIPVYLGIFEGFTHTMGVILTKAQKFYTPGMISAYCMCGFSILIIYYIASNHLGSGLEFFLGIICMFLSFAIMQNRVLSINGLGYDTMFKMMKRKFRH